MLSLSGSFAPAGEVHPSSLPRKFSSSRDTDLGHFCHGDRAFPQYLPIHSRQATPSQAANNKTWSSGKALAYSASPAPACISLLQFWIHTHWNPCWKYCLPVEDAYVHFNTFSDLTADKYRQRDTQFFTQVNWLYFSLHLKMLHQGGRGATETPYPLLPAPANMWGQMKWVSSSTKLTLWNCQACKCYMLS